MARRIVAAVLVVLASVLTPFALGAHWASRTVTDAERFAATVEPLATDPLVQQAIETAVADGLITAIDAEQRLDGIPLLPDQAVDAVASGVNSAVRTEVERFVNGERFAALWVRLTTAVQEQFVTAVEGDSTGPLALEDGRIVLDTAVVAEAVQAELVARGVPFVGEIDTSRIEGEIELAETPNLELFLDAMRIFLPIAAWLWVVALGMFVAGVLLWRPRARGLIWSGLGLLLGGLAAFAGLQLGTTAISGSAPTPNLAALARRIMETLVVSLQNAVLLTTAVGLALMIGAWLAGATASGSLVRGAVTDTAHDWGSALAEGPVGRGAARQPLLVPALRGAVVLAAAAWLLTRDLLTPSVLGWTLAAVAVGLLLVEVVEGSGRERDAARAGARAVAG